MAMKRLGIYLTYDKERKIDPYIGYMLKELKTCVKYLVVVCNEEEVTDGLENIVDYADEIFYRENRGFDAGGFKTAMCEFIGWDKILQYDELVLVNDSMFGPFIPMKDIFAEMNKRSVDFWGLASQGAREGKNIRSFPQYIQSYFLVVRFPMLHSAEFRKYWEEIPLYHKFWDVVIQHEERFTSYFSGLGYTYDVYADIEENDSKKNLANNYSQYATISYELIKKRNFPFLKKQQIAYNTLSLQTQENLFQAITYIDKETSYNVNLIWENIIRTLNMTDLQRNLHIQYAISSDRRRNIENRKVAIIVLAEHKEAAEYIWEYLDDFVNNSNYFIQVISEKEEILEAYKEKKISRRKQYSGQKYNVDEICMYDFVCILHDADVTSDNKPSYNGKSYLYCLWNNLLKNNNHVLGIIDKFEKNDRLGFLAPPQPNFAEYFGNICGRWNGNYERIEKIIRRLNLNCPILEEKPPYRVTNDFWIRGKILERLQDLEIEDYPYTPYLWSYFAQDAGYYSGIVESQEYAAMNEVNLQYYLQETAAQIRKYIGGFRYFYEMKDSIFILALEQYCKRHKKIMIYGTGKAAEEHRKYISNAECFLVSDGQIKQEKFHGLPVKYLSEIPALDEYGIVLCLNEKNQKEVIPLLERQGVQDYFCI